VNVKRELRIECGRGNSEFARRARFVVEGVMESIRLHASRKRTHPSDYEHMSLSICIPPQ
jgi:hypothetical protein